MNDDLQPASGGELEAAATERAAELVRETTPPATVRARQGALRYYEAWATARHGAANWPIHTETLLAFIIEHLEGLDEDLDQILVEKGVKRPGTHSVATIEARVAHLSKAHRAQGLGSPADDERVRSLLTAARRQRAQHGGQDRAAAAALGELEALLVAAQGEQMIDIRDRALLLVGWAAGGRRRSEIVSLNVEDLRPDGSDYVWTVRRSKTDQEGRGLAVPVAGRAAAALRAWLEAAEVVEGPVFRSVRRGGKVGDKALSGEAVRLMLKKRAKQAGLDQLVFSPHSLRAGFITESGRQGIPLAEAMQLSGHRSASVAVRYHRVGDVLRSKAARMAG